MYIWWHWEAFSTTKNSWTLAQSNATATVYAKFRDAAGNESSCISDTIEHDDEAPTGASISIDGGASYTSSATVSLSLTATGATEMNISNTTTFAAGNWTAYNPTVASWTHSQANSTATVYVRFRDAAGNETTEVSDTIIHDDIDPTVSITASSDINIANASNYPVTGTCDEAGVNVTIGGSASGTGLCDGSNFTAYIDYSAVSDGSVSVTADISDAAATARLNQRRL